MEDGHYNINVDILLLLLCTPKSSKICAEIPFVSKGLFIYANHRQVMVKIKDKMFQCNFIHQNPNIPSKDLCDLKCRLCGSAGFITIIFK